MVAEQLERLDHGDALPEVDARIVREPQLVSRPGHGEVRQPQAVLVVVDARVAGEQHAAGRHGGIDANVGPGPLQHRHDAWRAKSDLPHVERIRGHAEVAVGRGQRSVQRSVDRQGSSVELAGQLRSRSPQMDLRIRCARRSRDVRGEMRRPREWRRSLLPEGSYGRRDHLQIGRPHVQVQRERIERGDSVRGDAQTERGGGESAHQRFAPADFGLGLDAHFAHPVDPRGADVSAQGDVPADPVSIEPWESLPPRLDPAGHLAGGSSGRHALGIDAVERHGDLPGRRLAQGHAGVDCDAPAPTDEPRRQGDRIAAHSRVRFSAYLTRKGGGAFGRENRHVARQEPQIAHVQLAAAAAQVVLSVRGESALAEGDAQLANLRIAGSRGAGQERVEVERDRVFSGRAELGPEADARIGAVRCVPHVRCGDVDAFEGEGGFGAKGRPHGDASSRQPQTGHVDDPLERAGLRLRLRGRIAWLQRTAQRRSRCSVRSFDRGDVDPRPDELHVAEQHLVGPERQRIHVRANPVGRDRGIAVRVAEIDVVCADRQESAYLDGADGEPAANRAACVVDDDRGHLPRSRPGMQPDDRHHDRQDDEAEQGERAEPNPAQGAPTRPRRGQAGARPSHVGRRHLGRVGFAHALAILGARRSVGTHRNSGRQNASPRVT